MGLSENRVYPLKWQLRSGHDRVSKPPNFRVSFNIRLLGRRKHALAMVEMGWYNHGYPNPDG